MSVGDSMQLKDEVQVGLGAVESEPEPATFVLEISHSYQKKLLMGGIEFDVVQVHVENAMENWMNSSQLSEMTITIKKEKK